MSGWRRNAASAMVGLLPLLGGCQLIALPWLLWGKEPTKTIPAEYPYLADKRVCIVVRADMETLVEYPHLQHELADYVRVALEAHVASLKVVAPEKVVDYQRSNPQWESMDPAKLGKQFEAERLVELVLTQYTTREPENPYQERGHIAALVNVYNTDYPESAPAYTSEVRVSYPPDGPGDWGTDDRQIRAASMEAFAEEAAGRFYDRKVKVQ